MTGQWPRERSADVECGCKAYESVRREKVVSQGLSWRYNALAAWHPTSHAPCADDGVPVGVVHAAVHALDGMTIDTTMEQRHFTNCIMSDAGWTRRWHDETNADAARAGGIPVAELRA